MSAAILVLPWQDKNYYKREMLNFPIPSFALCQKKRCITKAFQPIFKNFPTAERCENRYSGRKFHERNYVSFAMARWKLFSRGRIWNFPYSSVHCVRKNAISPKVFNRFSKTFALLEDVENRYLGRKFDERSYFSFAMATWKLLEKGNVKFPHYKLYTVSEKRDITKGIQPIFENFRSA